MANLFDLGRSLFCLFLFISFWGVSESVSSSPTNNSTNKLLLILLDGFRWDYLNKTNLTGFTELRHVGVHAEYMLPIFPSVSYPDYYSIATGLYGEDHGMVMNYMYDAEHREIFEMTPFPNSSRSYWWNDAEPIWITSTKSNNRTYVYSWPGCEMLIRDTRPTFCVAYDNDDSVELFHEQIGQALQNLANDEADFTIVYTEYTDETGHEYGPESKEMDDAVRNVDLIFDEMLQNMTTLGLENSVLVNIIIVSDHGMTATDEASVTRVSLKDVLNIDDIFLILDRGPFAAIYPVDGKLDAVFDSLQQLEGAYVWKRDDIPERFHMKKHPRCPPILVLMKPGYFVTAYTQSEKQIPYIPYVNDTNINGQHGYDVAEMPDMRAIFLAAGPDIRQNVEAHPINNTDVYNLAMYLLGLDPLPNNGSWDNVKDFLRN